MNTQLDEVKDVKDAAITSQIRAQKAMNEMIVCMDKHTEELLNHQRTAYEKQLAEIRQSQEQCSNDAGAKRKKLHDNATPENVMRERNCDANPRQICGWYCDTCAADITMCEPGCCQWCASPIPDCADLITDQPSSNDDDDDSNSYQVQIKRMDGKVLAKCTNCDEYVPIAF